MTVLLRRMLNGACWGVNVALRASDPLTDPNSQAAAQLAIQTAILTATL